MLLVSSIFVPYKKSNKQLPIDNASHLDGYFNKRLKFVISLARFLQSARNKTPPRFYWVVMVGFMKSNKDGSAYTIGYRC